MAMNKFAHLNESGERMTNRTGQHWGHYRLTCRPGKGEAVVYLGEHVHLKTLVAIKVLHKVQLADDEEEKFRKEAYTMANFKHSLYVTGLRLWSV